MRARSNLVDIYALSVCFAALLIFIIAMVTSVSSVIKISFPALSLSTEDFKRYQDNDAYYFHILEKQMASCEGKISARPEDNDLTRQRLRERIGALAAAEYDNLQQLISSLLYTLSAALIFTIHWRIADKYRKK